MKILEKIKHAAGRHYLRKAIENNQRTRKLIHIESVKSIGILFELDDEQTYHIVHAEVIKWQDLQVKVKVLGYVREERLTLNIMPLLAFDFFFEKQLNWYKKPKAGKAEDFAGKEFDVLIDLNIHRQFPLQCIAAVSQAHLKVGIFDEMNDKTHDIMIQYAEGTGLKELLHHIHHYLKQLNPGRNEQ